MNKLTFFLLLTFAVPVMAQSQSFTYQGSLSSGGVPANGNYDFQFGLYGEAAIGGPVLLEQAFNDVPVTNGTFSVALSNFSAKFSGGERFLEIRVRPAGVGNFTLLLNRTRVTSSPYSYRSLNSANADALGGTPAIQFVRDGDVRLSDARDPLPNSASYIQNRTLPQPSTNFNITGNGTIGGLLTVKDKGAFEKEVLVATTLDVGTTLAVGSTANVAGSINTGTQYNVGGNFVLNRSRHDLFSTDATPRGFSFQMMNSPNFLLLKNDVGTPLITFTLDGKVGIGDNNPTSTVSVGGTLAVSQMGGATGEQLCKGTGNTIRACSVTAGPQSNVMNIATLESVIREQQVEMERLAKELAMLKSFICSQNPPAGMCAPQK